MDKILFISNIAKRVGAFSMASIFAARQLNLEFHMFAKWCATSEQIDEDSRKYNVIIHNTDLERSPYSLRNLKAYKALTQTICDHEVDYIHCNTPVGGVLGRLAGKKCKVKKVIYQAHGLHFYKGAPWRNWLLYYPIEKLLARFTDAMITINTEDYALAMKKFKLRKGGKVYYVPGVGIDTAQFCTDKSLREEKRKDLNIPPDAFVMISAGELNTNKNNRVILSALEQIKDSNIHYVLCGVGDLEFDLKKQAADAGLLKNVHFLGYRNDISELYAMADCFVMPSFREGLSRSIMEAMASGLPCIASKIRGNTDLIVNGSGGFLCTPTDYTEFANAIRTLAEDPHLCEKFGEFNRTKVKEFDISVVTEELKKIYTDLRG